MDMMARARTVLRLGGKEIAIGEVFDPADYGKRNWTSMMRRGDIEYLRRDEVKAPVAPAEGEEGGAASEEVAPSPYLSMTRKELIEVLEELGVEEDDVEGSGSNGYATVEDLREYVLKAKEDEADVE